MKAYKGFDKNMQCRGFQFEEGETYEEDRAVLCRAGFHACKNPIDVFRYYAPGKSIFHEVELEDVSEMAEKDSKVCGKKIKIGAEISLRDMIRAGVKIDIQTANTATSGHSSPAATSWDSSPAATSGDSSPAATSEDSSPAATSGCYSHAATSGGYSHAATSGVSSPAATSGHSSPAATSGDYSHAATSGNYSHAATSGNSSLAATSGNYSHAATSGNYSHAATSGNYSHADTSGNSSPAVTSGYHSPAATSGKDSIAAAIGRDSKAKSTLGNWIVLAEYGDWNGKCYPVRCVKCGKIDGEFLKPDMWYRLEDGEFVEAGEDE